MVPVFTNTTDSTSSSGYTNMKWHYESSQSQHAALVPGYTNNMWHYLSSQTQYSPLVSGYTNIWHYQSSQTQHRTLTDFRDKHKELTDFWDTTFGTNRFQWHNI